MQTAFLYHQNGSPKIEQDYYAPGKFSWQQATCRLEEHKKEGELVTLHVGFGVHHVYEVAAADDRTAILVRADVSTEMRALSAT